ncbi:hypothetical protein PDE_08658 [Penicillium oxalicum 114-2]|uniref:Uncharacterized protein n=1 Tax=Penicillium oxalicum (strain 114-2 / CGMCC 5302) TaxID=933388 RepID=S7ZY09_PENO1|nr:hypothetical protein PDE_08658 [Penicillium oxalicum 114-2]
MMASRKENKRYPRISARDRADSVVVVVCLHAFESLFESPFSFFFCSEDESITPFFCDPPQILLLLSRFVMIFGSRFSPRSSSISILLVCAAHEKASGDTQVTEFFANPASR